MPNIFYKSIYAFFIILFSGSISLSEPPLENTLINLFCICEDPYKDYSFYFLNDENLKTNDSVIPMLLNMYFISNQFGISFNKYIMKYKCHQFDTSKYCSMELMKKSEKSFDFNDYAQKIITSFGEGAVPYLLDHIEKGRGDDDIILRMLRYTATNKYKKSIADKLLIKYKYCLPDFGSVVDILASLGDSVSAVPVIDSILANNITCFDDKLRYIEILGDLKSTRSLSIIHNILCKYLERRAYDIRKTNYIWDPEVVIPTALWKITGADRYFTDMYYTPGKQISKKLYKELKGNNHHCQHVCNVWRKIIKKYQMVNKF